MLDLRRQGGGEDTWESLQEVELGIRAPLGERWWMTVEGRMTWWMTSGHAGPDSPRITSPAGWEGRWEPMLRDAYVSGRRGSWQWRLGQGQVSWGSTDFFRPMDRITARDLRRPLAGGGREEARIPVPLVEGTWLGRAGSVQLLAVPFFVPDRVMLFGGDQAPLREGSPLSERAPVGFLVDAVDPSVEDRVNDAAAATRLPEETLRNLQAGARLTSTGLGMDVSLSIFHGFDRQRWLRIAPSLAQLGRVVAENGTGFSPALLGAVGDVQADLDAGRALLVAEHRRTTTVGLDGVRYVGRVGVRWETTWSALQTGSTEALEPVRAPMVASALGLSSENPERVTWAVEGFHQHTVGGDGEPWVLSLDALWGVFVGSQWRLGRWRAGGPRRQDVSLRLGGVYLGPGQDILALPSLVWEREDWSVEAGVGVFASLDEGRETLGDLLAWNDSAWMRLRRRF
jgi:hypothetical protein